jgi:hypothetical protein
MTAPAILLCDDPGQPPSRLSVDDDGETITIERELLSSRSPLARVTGLHGLIEANPDEAAWLRKRAQRVARKPR